MPDPTSEAQEELKKQLISHLYLTYGKVAKGSVEHIMALIAADKERAVREARLDELECSTVPDYFFWNKDGKTMTVGERKAELQSHQEKETE